MKEEPVSDNQMILATASREELLCCWLTSIEMVMEEHMKTVPREFVFKLAARQLEEFREKVENACQSDLSIN